MSAELIGNFLPAIDGIRSLSEGISEQMNEPTVRKAVAAALLVASAGVGVPLGWMMIRDIRRWNREDELNLQAAIQVLDQPHNNYLCTEEP